MEMSRAGMSSRDGSSTARPLKGLMLEGNLSLVGPSVRGVAVGCGVDVGVSVAVGEGPGVIVNVLVGVAVGSGVAGWQAARKMKIVKYNARYFRMSRLYARHGRNPPAPLVV